MVYHCKFYVFSSNLCVFFAPKRVFCYPFQSVWFRGKVDMRERTSSTSFCKSGWKTWYGKLRCSQAFIWHYFFPTTFPFCSFQSVCSKFYYFFFQILLQLPYYWAQTHCYLNVYLFYIVIDKNIYIYLNRAEWRERIHLMDRT